MVNDDDDTGMGRRWLSVSNNADFTSKNNTGIWWVTINKFRRKKTLHQHTLKKIDLTEWK